MVSHNIFSSATHSGKVTEGVIGPFLMAQTFVVGSRLLFIEKLSYFSNRSTVLMNWSFASTSSGRDARLRILGRYFGGGSARRFMVNFLY